MLLTSPTTPGRWSTPAGNATAPRAPRPPGARDLGLGSGPATLPPVALHRPGEAHAPRAAALQNARRATRPVAPATARLLALASLALAATAQSGCSAGALLARRAGGGGGGRTSALLGGVTAPTTATLASPDNPQTPSTQTVEKTTERLYADSPSFPSENFPASPSPRPSVSTSPHLSVPASQPPSAPSGSASSTSTSNSPLAYGGASAPPYALRETVTERATTTLGISRRDTAADLTARLSNLRGVLWVGVLLFIGGPLLGWQLGWFLNGCIAGAVGLLLIILSTVLPGHEAWFGLAGLGLIPAIAYVYYRAHHDATRSATPSAPPSPTT